MAQRVGRRRTCDQEVASYVSPPKKKGGTAPNFRLMSIVAKRSPISVTAEHLSIYLLNFALSDFSVFCLKSLSAAEFLCVCHFQIEIEACGVFRIQPSPSWSYN